MTRKDVAELLGLVAIVASLVFVGMQLRQEQKIAIAEGYSSYFSSRIEVANSIKEHVVIWKKGAAGHELEEAEAAIFALLVFQVGDSNVQGYLHTQLVEGEVGAEFIIQEFARFLYHNPGAREVWVRRVKFLEDNRRLLLDDYYPEPWGESVQTNLLKLDSIKPPIDTKVFVDW
jgi:hypothetical protein